MDVELLCRCRLDRTLQTWTLVPIFLIFYNNETKSQSRINMSRVPTLAVTRENWFSLFPPMTSSLSV